MMDRAKQRRAIWMIASVAMVCAIVVAYQLAPNGAPHITPTAAISSTTTRVGVTQTHSVTPNEPSGIAWSPSREALWIVSDDDTAATLVDTNGTQLAQYDINTNHADWEGITELPNGDIAVVSEAERHILVIDPEERTVVRTVRLSTLADDSELAALIEAGGENKGLEGITVDPRGSVWVIKEAQPILLIQLDQDMTRITRWVDPTASLTAALGIDGDDLDLSGLSIDPVNHDILWIASHKAETVFQWDTSTGTVLSSHPVATPKIEGITIAPDLTAYGVDDRTQHLLHLGDTQIP